MLFFEVSSIKDNFLISDRDDDRAHIHELLLVWFDFFQIEWIFESFGEFLVASNIKICNPIEVSQCVLKGPWPCTITDLCSCYVVLSCLSTKFHCKRVYNICTSTYLSVSDEAVPLQPIRN